MEKGDATRAQADGLLAMCHDGLAEFTAEREEAIDLLDGLIGCGHSETSKAAQRYRQQLDALEPSVTMIGQVKAGKTSLVNAMIGAPGLLPADVNPWTSVVTSLHLGPRAAKAPHAARFTFFEPEDWERLTRKGGRMGELAGRSGAEEEAEKVRRQIEQMRDKTRRRLGRRFELLLGTHHEYGAIEPGLIERYVCLGDDHACDEGTEHPGTGGPGTGDQGRFADITKAAELWLPREDWPLGLCLRDTPGVNDTFMMREQITIGAIRDSRLCVVVLSAHQALSSVDMALIRLISNVRAREVIIFVNRIDELPDPATQIDEIRQSIRTTLSDHPGLGDVEILFGSAHWATLALRGALSELDDEGATTLLAHAEHVLPGLDTEMQPMELIWWLSGVPALYRAIWARIAEGAARETLRSVARSGMNLAIGLSAAAAADPLRAARDAAQPVDTSAMTSAVDDLEQRVLSQFDVTFRDALRNAEGRLDRASRSFLDRATAALVKHLEIYGELAPWTYDPTGLRLLLRSGYQVFARQVNLTGAQAGEAAAKGIAEIYSDALGRPAEEFDVQAPPVPRLPPPILLGQTIALDLRGTWWRRWWNRRRGYKSFAPEFHEMISAETRPIVTALKETHCATAADDMRTFLEEFFADQRMLIGNLAERAESVGRAEASTVQGHEALSKTVTRLSRLAA